MQGKIKALGLAHDRSPHAYQVTQALSSDCPTHHDDNSGVEADSKQHNTHTHSPPKVGLKRCHSQWISMNKD